MLVSLALLCACAGRAGAGRPRFHVGGRGNVSALAGVVFHRGQYHAVFTEGAGRWAHAASDDLATWRELSAPLAPAGAHEAGGGCLALYGRYVALVYSGRAARSRRYTQNVALTEDGARLQRYCRNPVIETMDDLGDPFVWSHGSTWYMVLAARGPRGRLVLYSAPHLLQWRYQSVLAEAEAPGAWESPSLLVMRDADVLLLTVRKGELSAAAYVIGAVDYSVGKFVTHSRAPFRMLDHGHDLRGVRASTAADGRTLLLGLLGPALAVPREVRAAAGRLLVSPARELAALRLERLESAWYEPGESFDAEHASFELLVKAAPVKSRVELRLEWPNGAWAHLQYDWARGLVSLRRGGPGAAGAAGGGDARRGAALHADAVRWRVFVDAGAVEVFCGEGEAVFSSWLRASRSPVVRVLGDTRLHVEQYLLKRAMVRGGRNDTDD